MDQSLNGIPPAIAETVGNLCLVLEAEVGDNLVSVTLYGSAARGLYRPNQSDINLLVVLNEVDSVRLQSLGKAIGQVTDLEIRPYVLQASEIQTASRAFPNRFLDMKRGYRVLAGKDVLADLQVDKDRLADRCREELLNILLRVRHCIILGDQGEGIVSRFLPQFTKALRTLVFLKTGEIVDQRGALINKAVELWGLPEEPFQQFLAWRDGQLHLTADEWNQAVGDFLDGVERVVKACNG